MFEGYPQDRLGAADPASGRHWWLRIALLPALLAATLGCPSPAFAATPELAAPLNPQFALIGGHTAAQRTIADLGDFNGDGIDDVAVGFPYASASGRPDAGRVAIVPVTATGVRLADEGAGETLDLIGGLRYRIGRELAAVGDVNGDGLADVLVGAPRKGVAGPKTPGSAFLIYGRRGGGTLDLAAPPSDYGLEIKGITADAYSSPQGLAGPGDMTGDGLADSVVVGGDYAKGSFRYRKGIYLIRGARTGADVDLQRLPASRGTKLVAVPGPAYPAISAAGQVNRDSRPDLIVSAPQVKIPGYRWPVNATFVLFTPASPRTITLPSIGTNGFRISGLAGPGYLTAPIAGLGDVNGDGLSDIGLIADTGGGGPGDSPRAAVIFGSGSNAVVSAGSPGARGFVLRSPTGTPANTRMYDAISAAGDLDGDGLADLAIHELNGPFDGAKPGTIVLVPGSATSGAIGSGSALDVDQLAPPALRLRSPTAPPECAGLDFGRAFAVIPVNRTGSGRALLAASIAGNDKCQSKLITFEPNAG